MSATPWVEGPEGHSYRVEWREATTPAYSVIGRLTVNQFRAACECGWRGRWDDVDAYDVATAVKRRVIAHYIRAGLPGWNFPLFSNDDDEVNP